MMEQDPTNPAYLEEGEEGGRDGEEVSAEP
jgi:hypothetical protein